MLDSVPISGKTTTLMGSSGWYEHCFVDSDSRSSGLRVLPESDLREGH